MTLISPDGGGSTGIAGDQVADPPATGARPTRVPSGSEAVAEPSGVDRTLAPAPKRRRRGDDLEDALLLAAWQEFQAEGFDGFTVDAVAQRAGTSRAVLYRRWPGKAELVAAAVRHAIAKDRGPTPEPTGTLRGDLIAWLRWANQTDVRTMISATTHVGAYLATQGMTFADARKMVVPNPGRSSASAIDAAVARGEIDPAHLTPRLTSLAFDLFRHELVLNAQPLTDQAIVEIVDQIVVPLLTRRF